VMVCFLFLAKSRQVCPQSWCPVIRTDCSAFPFLVNTFAA